MMKGNARDKKDYLVATEASIFPGGDEEIMDDFSEEILDVDDILDDDLMEFETDSDDSDGAGDLFGSASAKIDDEEPEALSGKKAAFFNTVTTPEKKETTDWLQDEPAGSSPQQTADTMVDLSNFDDDDEFGDIEIDGDILMDGDFGDEPADDLGSVEVLKDPPQEPAVDVKEPSDAELPVVEDVLDDEFVDFDLDLDEEPEEMTGRKASLFSSVEPAESNVVKVEENDGDEPTSMTGHKAALFHSVESPESADIKGEDDDLEVEPVVEEPAAQSMPTLAPLKPLADAPVNMNTDKVAAEYGTDASVFGAAGGQANTSKQSAKIAKTMRYLNQEAIAGLDLWEDGATACFLKWGHDKLLVTHAGHIEFPEGVGDQEKSTLLRGFWKNLKMPTRSVWVNVHNASLLQKYVKYDMPIDELEPALRKDAEESMPGAVGNVAIDWVIKERFGGGGEGLLFALPVWEQEHLISLLRKAGLFVCGLSVAACDIARLLMLTRPDGSGKGSAECVCCLSRTGADIVITYGDGAIYSRTVYSRAGGWEKNLMYLYECINDAVNHFNSWINRNPVATVLLCGQVPEVDDLGGEMLRETGLLVEVWNPMAAGDVFELAGAAKRSGVLGRNLAGCLGLAMQRG